MKTSLFLFMGVIFVLAAAFYFYLPWRWSKWNPNWVIKESEEIEEIIYVTEEPDTTMATVVVYLRGSRGGAKLSQKDTMAVNGQPMKNPKYYNNGEAVGFKYLLEIPRAKEYTLSLQREGRPPITKVTHAVLLPKP